MSLIFPFPGWRYDPGKVDLSKVVAPPYDVISPQEQDMLYSRDDRNVVRLTFGKTHSDDTPASNRYTRAASHLDAWRGDGLFIQDKPSIYLYEQKFSSGNKDYVRRGFFAKLRLSEWGKEGVYPHEKTLSGPKQDRLDLMRSTRGNLEPIFGLVTDPKGEIESCLTNLVDYEPFLNIDQDDVQNRLWVVDQEEAIHRLLSLMPEPEIYIADGHHRYETALAYQAEVREKMRQAGQVPPLRGDLDCDYILMFFVPDSDPGLVIWPTHRLVYGLKDFSPDQFLKDCEPNFTVTPSSKESLEADLAASETPAFGFTADGKTIYSLSLKSREAMNQSHPDAVEAWRVLDVSVLQSLIMNDLLGIDEGKLLRKENIIYSKSLDETLADTAAHKDGVQCAFILRDTPMQQVRDIAEAGAVMPQKSTYFYPKPLSGMMFYLFW